MKKEGRRPCAYSFKGKDKSLFHNASFEGSIKLHTHEDPKPEFKETAKSHLQLQLINKGALLLPNNIF